VNPAAGAAATVTGSEFQAAGGYQCTSSGFLRVTIGSEVLDVPVTCV